MEHISVDLKLQDGQLSIHLSCTEAGSQYDNHATALDFTRPPEFAGDDLLLLFDNGAKSFDAVYLGGGNRFSLPCSLTQTHRLSLQAAFERKGQILIHSDIASLQLRPSLRGALRSYPVEGYASGVPEAPADGKTYGRRDTAWAEVTSGAGVPEAPADGKTYGRRDAAWAEVTSGSDPLPASIAFPAVFFAAQGKPLEIYYESILAVLPEGYSALISGPNIGYSYARKFTLSTSLTPGTYPISLRVYDRSRAEVRRIALSVVVYRLPAAPSAQKMLFIGDSLTALGTNMMKAMQDYCTADFGSNLFTFLGTKGTAPYKNEGVGGGSVVSFTTNSANNPFWDTAGNKLSFAHYEQTNGIRPDIAVIQLGLNDIVSAERDAASTSAGLKTFVEQMRADWPETLVYIVTCGQCGSQDALANNWLSLFKPLSVMDKSMYDYTSAIMSAFAETPKVHVIPNYFAFDRDCNYVATQVAANPFIETPVQSGNDPLHPAPDAYRQIGANIYHTWMSAPYTGGASVTLTNLIRNGDFSSGSTGWTLNNGITLTPHGDGTATGLVPEGNRGSWSIQQAYGAKLPIGHKIYGRTVNQQSLVIDGAPSTAFNQFYFRQLFTDSSSKTIASRQSPALASLATSSGIAEVTSDVSNTYFSVWFGLSAAASVGGTTFILGNILCVDLTAAYGAGNEPDKAWCDANIPYFNGTAAV